MLVVMAFICLGLVYLASGGANNPNLRGTPTPVRAATEDALANVRSAATATPSATITDTPPAVMTNVQATLTPEPGATLVLEPETYYAQGNVNLRSCPKTDCERVGTLSGGATVTVTGVINGDEVEEGNVIWYEVSFGGGSAYVYSSLLSPQPPTPRPTARPQQQAVQQPPAQPAQPSFTCPSNCDGARAMGLSPEQAASCGLDRDGDGVACYGD
jgi:hypothetical protein